MFQDLTKSKAFGTCLGILALFLGMGAWASHSNDEVSYPPVADLNCSLPPAARVARLAFVRKQLFTEIQNLDQLAAHKRQTQADLDAMNTSYRVAQAFKITSDLAGFAAGYGSLKATLGGKEVIEIAGKIVPLLIGQSLALHNLLLLNDLKEGSLEVSFQRQLRDLLAKPLSMTANLAFLTSETCPNGLCPISSPEVLRLNEDLDQWFAVTLKRHQELAGWSVFEFFHRNYGNQLAQIELPYASGKVILKNLQIAHLELLKLTLLQDQAACDLNPQ